MGLHGPVTGEQQGALGRVTRAQRHLLGLINDILNYAKLESGRVEYDVQPVDAREVVAEVTALVEPQLAARPLALHVALPDALPPVWADREKLRKFTEPGGRVLVDLGTRREAGAAAGAASDATVFLRVTDTGVGVPRDKHEAIFEPFVQVRATPVRLQEGTGLGLAISRDLARGMGGDLRVRSAPGTGSTFTLTLRRAVDPDGRFTERRVAAERRVEDERRAVDDRRHDGDGRGEGGGGV
jgi:signal transduction histidine kinase